MLMALPDCPMYTSLHVLHCNLYIPLGLLLSPFSVSCCLIVLYGLKAMFRLVSLNKFVILLIIGLKYLNVTHFLPLCIFGSVLCGGLYLFVILFLILFIMCWGYPLFLAIARIVSHSLCFAVFVMGLFLMC